MSFTTNESQQLNFEDSFLNLKERTKKFLVGSWAKGFSEIISPVINEERFAVLYSSNSASRPNNPVNAVIGSLILKEMFSLNDDELLESILCDVRFQYALHTTSFEEQPFSDRTFSRFREKLYLYELETGRDLLHEEMEAMADAFVQYLNINPSVKRMDSVMVSSSSKKMSRLEIIYTCVANMIKAIHRTGEYQELKNMEHYLNEEDKNNIIYHSKNDDISSRIQNVITDATKLIEQLGDAYFEFPEYQLLLRVLLEQTQKNTEGKIIPKNKKDIAPDSLQNPSDPDATYRSKAGKDNRGYVGNFVETTDENGSIITSYDYEVNSHSDSDFCKETIDKLGPQETSTTLITDGAYGSIENLELAEKNNIELVTTALIGKTPDVVQADFKIDEANEEITQCPMGEKPYKQVIMNKLKCIVHLSIKKLAKTVHSENNVVQSSKRNQLMLSYQQKQSKELST